eukprot:9466379-Pyramimonas_sp.AAC.1
MHREWQRQQSQRVFGHVHTCPTRAPARAPRTGRGGGGAAAAPGPEKDPPELALFCRISAIDRAPTNGH